MDAYSILAEAINTKQQVVARYHDQERIFSPHALGTKRGISHVLVYQFGGGSQSGLPSEGEWRCLNVDELSDLRLEPGAWRTAANVSLSLCHGLPVASSISAISATMRAISAAVAGLTPARSRVNVSSTRRMISLLSDAPFCSAALAHRDRCSSLNRNLS